MLLQSLEAASLACVLPWRMLSVVTHVEESIWMWFGSTSISFLPFFFRRAGLKDRMHYLNQCSSLKKIKINQYIPVFPIGYTSVETDALDVPIQPTSKNIEPIHVPKTKSMANPIFNVNCRRLWYYWAT